MSSKNFFAVLQVNPQELAVVPCSVPQDVSVGLPVGLDSAWKIVDLESVQELIDDTFVAFVGLEDARVYQDHWQLSGSISAPSLH